MDIYTIGKILREERKKRGLTREEVYVATKISIMNIEAIEKGDFESLPHPVYTRAFIKRYAEFLEIDPSPLLEAYQEYYGEGLSPQIKKEVPFTEEKEGRKIWLIIILFLVLIGITGAFFKLQKQKTMEGKEKRGSILREVPETSEMGTNGSQGNASIKNTTMLSQRENVSNASSATKVPLVSSPPPPQEAQNATTNGSISSPPPTTFTNATASKKAQNATSSKQTHIVKVVAKDMCWMRGVMDQNSTREVLLKKGQSITFTFHNNMVLKLGNAGGVEVFVDGTPIRLKAREGTVKTLHFPLQNNG